MYVTIWRQRERVKTRGPFFAWCLRRARSIHFRSSNSAKDKIEIDLHKQVLKLKDFDSTLLLKITFSLLLLRKVHSLLTVNMTSRFNAGYTEFRTYALMSSAFLGLILGGLSTLLSSDYENSVSKSHFRDSERRKPRSLIFKTLLLSFWLRCFLTSPISSRK